MTDEPADVRRGRGAALLEAAREDLELYGLDDLADRIGMLEAEIVRTRAQIDKRNSTRAAADALFNKRD